MNDDFASYPDFGFNVPDRNATPVTDFPKAEGSNYLDIQEDRLNFLDIADLDKVKDALLALDGRSIYVTFVYDDPNCAGKSLMVTDILYGCDIACYDSSLPPYDFCKHKDPKLYGMLPGQANICDSWHPCQWSSNAQLK